MNLHRLLEWVQFFLYEFGLLLEKRNERFKGDFWVSFFLLSRGNWVGMEL